MSNREKILAFISAAAPDQVTNSDIRQGTGIEPHQQVYQLTQQLMLDGAIRGEQQGNEWYFWHRDPSTDIESAGRDSKSRAPSFFSDHSTNATRAQQLWQILVSAAMNRQTLTYARVAELIHFQVPVALARPLGHLMYWCQDNGLPPLTVLVVSERSGLPSDGLLIDGDLHRAREAVFAYDWYNVVPPGSDELAQVYRRHTNTEDA